jgi:lipoate-protein ligase A
VSSGWVPAPGLSDEYCPLGRRGDVLTVRDRVVGAAAQHLSGTALLHQGTLSLEVNRELVRELFAFDDVAAERLAGVHECGVRAGPDRLAETVAQELLAALGRG